MGLPTFFPALLLVALGACSATAEPTTPSAVADNVSDAGDAAEVGGDDTEPGDDDADSDNGDTDSANGDTDSDNGDADPDNGDADPDNGDADADNSDADPDNGDADSDNGDADADNGDADADNGDADADNGDAGPTSGNPNEDAYCQNDGHVTFQNTVGALLEEHCQQCHSSDAVVPQFPYFTDGLDSQAGFAASLAHLGRGFCYFRVSDTWDADGTPGSDFLMPDGGPALAAELQAEIKNWYYVDSNATPTTISGTCNNCHTTNDSSLPLMGAAFIDFVVNTLNEVNNTDHSHSMPPFTQLDPTTTDMEYIANWVARMRAVKASGGYVQAVVAGYGTDVGSIDLSEPSQDTLLAIGDSLDITYTSAGTASNPGAVVISIDSDSEGLDGEPLVGCLTTGTDETFTWDIDSAAKALVESQFEANASVAGRTFYLYACHYDADNATCRYADASVYLSY